MVRALKSVMGWRDVDKARGSGFRVHSWLCGTHVVNSIHRKGWLRETLWVRGLPLWGLDPVP